MQDRALRQIMVWGVKIIVPRQRVGVGVVVLDESERVLLLRHVFHPISPWGVPGGWLNRHESPEVGALRELREETGLTAVLGSVAHVMHSTKPHHIGIFYLATVDPGPITLSAEIIEAKWFALDELPPLLTFTRKGIETAVNVHRLHRTQKT